jgi:hypothetical protein
LPTQDRYLAVAAFSDEIDYPAQASLSIIAADASNFEFAAMGRLISQSSLTSFPHRILDAIGA